MAPVFFEQEPVETVDSGSSEQQLASEQASNAGNSVLVHSDSPTVETVDSASSAAPHDERYARGGEWHRYESATGRIFHMTTRLNHPQSGVELITRDRIANAVNRPAIKRYAWIVHDKDVYVEADLGKNTSAVLGELKPPHLHLVEERKSSASIASVARAYGIPPTFVRLLKGHGAFLGAAEYLTHRHPKQVALGKTVYSSDEVTANFDYASEMDALSSGRESGDPSGSRKKRDEIHLAVMHGEKTLRQVRLDEPLLYSRDLRKLHDLRRDFMLASPPPSSRINYYIHGQSGAGKSILARMLARALYPDLEPEECYYDAGDPKVMAQNYGGQPVMILDDYRPGDLMIGFGSRTSVWRAFDTSPGRADVNIKHGSVRMVQAVNVVTGVVPYIDFLSNLAGNYTGPDGVRHEAEDDRQAFRRFPFVIEVTPQTFEFYASTGFFEGTEEYRNYRQLFTMKASMRELAATLEEIDSEEGKDEFRRAVGERVLGGMLDAHRSVRPKGNLAAQDAVARLNSIETLTGDDMERHREARIADAEAAALAAREREQRSWDALAVAPEGWVG